MLSLYTEGNTIYRKGVASMYCDYHLHSSFSGDSKTPMEEMIRQGIRLGLPAMCFTEHLDPDFPDGDCSFDLDIPAYQEKLMELKESYQDRIQIYFGLELGLQPHLTKEIPRIAASAPFDFLIGSTHVADHMDPYEKTFFQGRTEYEAYHRYFEVLLENLKTFSCFDTCGHIDYVVRYGPNQNRDYTYEKYQDILDEVLKTLIEKQIGLECNTAGFKYGLGHPNPTEKILARYRELGGEILTLGSDAHAPEHIAYNFRETGEILKACGFRYYTIFKERKPEFLSL